MYGPGEIPVTTAATPRGSQQSLASEPQGPLPQPQVFAVPFAPAPRDPRTQPQTTSVYTEATPTASYQSTAAANDAFYR